MISLNGAKVELGHFPDGTLLIKNLPINNICHVQTITWKFEHNEELIALYFITRHLQNQNYEVILVMPYLPNARQDRTKSINDCFTLKYFAEIINSLNFYKVEVFDVHSHVGEALIDRLETISVKPFIEQAIEKISNSNKFPILCFPDEGSVKRYAHMFNLPYVFGIKERDWQTGKINKLTLVGDTSEIEGRNVLIVDDICSRGGTFYYMAIELRKYNPASVSLYVTHCENTVLDGDLIKSGLLRKIYTTDSIFTKQHELIEIMQIEGE